MNGPSKRCFGQLLPKPLGFGLFKADLTKTESIQVCSRCARGHRCVGLFSGLFSTKVLVVDWWSVHGCLLVYSRSSSARQLPSGWPRGRRIVAAVRGTQPGVLEPHHNFAKGPVWPNVIYLISLISFSFGGARSGLSFPNAHTRNCTTTGGGGGGRGGRAGAWP